MSSRFWGLYLLLASASRADVFVGTVESRSHSRLCLSRRERELWGRQAIEFGKNVRRARPRSFLPIATVSRFSSSSCAEMGSSAQGRQKEKWRTGTVRGGLCRSVSAISKGNQRRAKIAGYGCAMAAKWTHREYDARCRMGAREGCARGRVGQTAGWRVRP